MNSSIVRIIIGQVLKVEAALLLLPCITALVYQEKVGIYYLITAAACLAVGFIFTFRKSRNDVFYLKEGLVAANDPEHKDSLKVSFTAEALSQHGEFSIDFQNTAASGTPHYEVLWLDPEGTVSETISETLTFWPQGNRTMSWQYGFLSSSYITTFQSFTVTSVSGSIFLLSR